MKGDEKAMAITYKKALKTVVFTLHDASTVTATDTVEASIGSAALAMYEKKDLIYVPGESATTIFDFAQVIKAEVSVQASDEITKADPYCEEESASE